MIKAKTQIRYILVLKRNVNLVYEYYLTENYISLHIYSMYMNVKKAYSDVLGSSIVMVHSCVTAWRSYIQLLVLAGYEIWHHSKCNWSNPGNMLVYRTK